jgi:hypothetical protein
VSTYRTIGDDDEALTRADIIAVRGPDMRPLPEPPKVKPARRPDRHGTRYAWTKGCRCSLCHAASKAYNVQQSETRRLREASQ